MYQENDLFPFHILHSVAAKVILSKDFAVAVTNMIVHKPEFAAGAPKPLRVALIYCLWRGSSSSWSYLDQVFMKALYLVAIARKNELVSWGCHPYSDSSELPQIIPISGQQNAMRDLGFFL